MRRVCKTQSVARQNLARLPRNYRLRGRGRLRVLEEQRAEDQFSGIKPPAVVVACSKSHINLVQQTQMLTGKAELAVVVRMVTKKCVEDK